MTSRDRRDLFVATFAILVLELALIRWTSQQVTVFAYLNNVLLMSAFLGLGLGVTLGKRDPRIFHFTLPILAVLAAVLAFSERLWIAHIGFPSGAMPMWGSEKVRYFVVTCEIVVALFVTTTAVFVCAGAKVGEIFGRSEPLKAYSSDLAGSLLGVIAMTILAASETPPPVWFAVATIPLAFLSLRWTSWFSAAAIIVLAAISIRGAYFSPYYRIDIDRSLDVTGAPLRLSVNRDFHQYMHDFSPRHLGDPSLTPLQRARLREAEVQYRFPFLLSTNKNRALVVGGGTGNDAAAALRAGFGEVVSVDIDPRIIAIGREMHPERPYDNPRVVPIVNDARAYFEQRRGETFDAVVFGLLDSHAMFSAMGSLRLDNYVYTVEAMRAAWSHVRQPGIMSISFSIGDHEWLSDRLAGIVRQATGVQLLIVPHGIQHGRFFIVSKGIDLRALQRRLGFQTLPDPASNLRLSRDDWPFLYLKPGEFPYSYIAVLAAIIAFAVVGTRLVFGPGIFARGRFDAPLFWMGAAFLLIETRSVTDLSLLFGSTWIVNAAVFAGILAIAWVANALTRRYQPTDLRPLFALLCAALIVNYFVRPDLLLRLPILARGVAGGLLTAIPIGFAGVIFSSLLRDSAEADASLGSNLLGAVIGGCLEYSGMVTGLRALTLLAIALYVIAAAMMLRRKSRAVAPA